MGMYEHIRFVGSEKLIACLSNHGDAILGRVMWSERFLAYEFIAEDGAAFNQGCLRDMADFVGLLNMERGAK
jgi:hypothetical protein